ncbi:hypothetical protein DRQ50_00590 [bacterium]|nr:MAG: hypothetical protein DRQ50_00590 [bacterium]
MRGRRVSGRFAVLRAAVVLAALALVVRVVQIQVFMHDECKAKADGLWWQETALPAVRGDLYDRHGRPLALSVSTWRVGVATSLMDDREKVVSTLAEVLDWDAVDLRRRLTRAGGHVVLNKSVVLSRDQKANLRRVRAVTLDTVRARVYPAGGVGAATIGFCREGGDTTVATGMEHSLRHVLAGRPGRCQSVTTAVPGRDLGRLVLEEAVHGHDVRLTMDIELQAISEERLAAAIAATGSRGGSVLILDPHTGDVLAAASAPLMGDRQARQTDEAVWQNSNFTKQFEPGSVFKIFTVASLLRRAAIDTSSIFDCSDSDFGSFRIRNDDDHKYGDLALMPAFSKSSNIYFARAVANLDPSEMHRDFLDFGFGQATAMPYPGQAAGILRSPEEWSVRSQPTLAIGQELAVTPLQLGLAVCAVANGGALYAPRLVSTIRDADGRVTERFPPVLLRRVISAPLAAVLREAMGRAVREGTGKGTNLDWISIGGKTGTAQKQREGRGYTAGAYIASFAGIVPLDEPRLVILTTLDEPRGYHYYAAESAVPLFRAVVEDIRFTTDWLTGAPGARTAQLEMAAAPDDAVVPDVLHLSAACAVQRLAAAGLVGAGAGRDGVVVAQTPAAGASCPAGHQVQLVVAGRRNPQATSRQLCPDFAGLSNRQAQGLAARLGIDVAIRGAGYAVAQDPAPGRPLQGHPVRLRMEGTWH